MRTAEEFLALPLLPLFSLCLSTRRYKEGKIFVSVLLMAHIGIYIGSVVLLGFPHLIFFSFLILSAILALVSDKYRWSRKLVDVCFEVITPAAAYLRRRFRRKRIK